MYFEFLFSFCLCIVSSAFVLFILARCNDQFMAEGLFNFWYLKRHQYFEWGYGQKKHAIQRYPYFV